MSTWAIAVCAVLYLVTAYDLVQNGQIGLALAFVCYAVANIGLILATYRV
jgi:hypothetical protein